jgi:hypothetical protein
MNYKKSHTNVIYILPQKYEFLYKGKVKSQTRPCVRSVAIIGNKVKYAKWIRKTDLQIGSSCR